METREILTIQFGHYSNFVGTHWWNIQETNFSYDSSNPSEINSNVLFREGENLKKQITFTPRLLLVDLKESLGYLSKNGELYGPAISTDECDPLWDNVEIKAEEKIPKSDFVQNLDNYDNENTDIENVFDEKEPILWTDFLVPRFHPRTVNIIEEYSHEKTENPFDFFHLGENLWNNDTFNETFTDKIRLYVEECDLIQGFQVLLDSTNGFAGLGSSCIQFLRDEYGKSIIAFPVIDSKISEPKASDLLRALNISLCWEQVGEHSSLYSPLCCGETGWLQPEKPRKFHHLLYDLNNKYNSSALLATALDTITLRYRHKKHTMSALSDLCSDLSRFGRKAAAVSLSLPFPMKHKHDLLDVLDTFEGDLWTSLTPNCPITMDKNIQSLTLRGIPEVRLKRPLHEAKRQISKPAYKCSTVHEMMSLYIAAYSYASATYLVTVEQGLQIKPPYPNIFNNNIYSNGDVADWPVGEDIKSVPVLAGIHSTNGMSQMFNSLHERISKIRNIKRFSGISMEQDEYVEIMNGLLDQEEAYRDQYI